MQIEQVVVRLVADTSQYFRKLDYAAARLVGFSAGIVTAVASQGIAMQAEFERTSIAFDAMAKDATKSKKLMDDLVNLAVETPFKSSELAAGAKQLKAFGFETEDLIGTLTSIGNISAGTNTSIERIILAFGQVKVAGKLMGTELRQFVDAGIPIIEHIAKVMGKPEASIRRLVEQGYVGFDVVADAMRMMTTDGGIFAGMMERINKESISGRWQALSETLEIQQRNFVKAAFAGFRLNDALTKITNAIGTGTGDNYGKNIFIVFENIRTAVDFVVLSIKYLSSEISKNTDSVTKWVSEHKLIVARIVAAVAAAWLLVAVIKTLTYTVLVFRAVWRSLLFISGIASIVSSFRSLRASIVGAFVGLTPWLPLIITIALAAAAIAATFALLENQFDASKLLSGFDGMGSAFVQGIAEISNTWAYAWKGIVDSVKAGDIEHAFKIIAKSIEMTWRILMLTMKAEVKGFVVGLDGTTDEVAKGFGVMALDLQAATQSRAVKTRGSLGIDSEQEVNAKLARIENQRRSEINNILKASQKSIQDQMSEVKKTKDFILTNDADIKRINEELKQIVEEAADKRKASIVTDFFRENNPELQKIQAELKVFIESKIDKKTGNLFGGLFKDLDDFKKTVKENQIKGTPADMGALRSDILLGLIPKKFQDWAEKNKQAFGGGVPIIPSPFNRPIDDPSADQKSIRRYYTISGPAREAANDLQRDIGKGISPLDTFSDQFRNLTEALNGPNSAKGQLALGGGLLTAAVKEFQGIISKEEFGMGITKEYDKLSESLKKSGASEKDKPVPVMLFGSVGAQTTINDQIAQPVSLEDQILKTLTEAKAVQDQTADYTKRVAEAFERLEAAGKLDQFKQLKQPRELAPIPKPI